VQGGHAGEVAGEGSHLHNTLRYNWLASTGTSMPPLLGGSAQQTARMHVGSFWIPQSFDFCSMLHGSQAAEQEYIAANRCACACSVCWQLAQSMQCASSCLATAPTGFSLYAFAVIQKLGHTCFSCCLLGEAGGCCVCRALSLCALRNTRGSALCNTICWGLEGEGSC